jgi:CheY-like chemotaxis protein
MGVCEWKRGGPPCTFGRVSYLPAVAPMIREAKILLVDDDPWSLRIATSALSGLGYGLDTASDGATALAKALVSPPDLVISDVMMPGMSGWTLVCRVRSHRQLAFIPFIFLTSLDSRHDRLKGFRLGADDYLPKPFQPEELELRVASVLRRRDAIARRSREELQAAIPASRGFSGSLHDIGVASLLVLLELERKSGLLVLGRGQIRARLFVRDGQIVAAFIDGLSLRGEEVVFEALRWPEGEFVYTSAPVDMVDEIQSTTTRLLLEAARRLDEGGALEVDFADGDAL